MIIKKQYLEQIILEELRKEIEEGWFSDLKDKAVRVKDSISRKFLGSKLGKIFTKIGNSRFIKPMLDEMFDTEEKIARMKRDSAWAEHANNSQSAAEASKKMFARHDAISKKLGIAAAAAFLFLCAAEMVRDPGAISRIAHNQPSQSEVVKKMTKADRDKFVRELNSLEWANVGHSRITTDKRGDPYGVAFDNKEAQERYNYLYNIIRDYDEYHMSKFTAASKKRLSDEAYREKINKMSIQDRQKLVSDLNAIEKTNAEDPSVTTGTERLYSFDPEKPRKKFDDPNVQKQYDYLYNLLIDYDQQQEIKFYRKKKHAPKGDKIHKTTFEEEFYKQINAATSVEEVTKISQEAITKIVNAETGKSAKQHRRKETWKTKKL